MLRDFFNLNTPYETIKSSEDFVKQLRMSKHLTNILYEPDVLEPKNHPKLKIRDTIFQNISFSKTKLIKTVFINCSFEDCLFIGSELINCEFQSCKFINCNTHKISIQNTYLNPLSFANCFKGIDKANIGVHLFQQLISNSEVEGQSEFRRYARYHYRKWKDNLTLNKLIRKQPYKITISQFLISFVPSILYRYLFGYGLRLRNLTISFILIFILFFFTNYYNWNKYEIINKLPENQMQLCDSSILVPNFFYTIEATTKFIDSQLQTTTNQGMIWLIIQSGVGFLFLSALITIILNRFVK